MSEASCVRGVSARAERRARTGSFQPPLPVPGRPGLRGGVPLLLIVLSKLLITSSQSIRPGEQMSPVLRKRFATAPPHSHAASDPQSHM